MRIKNLDEISITRLEGGIPLILAKDECDMYFGIGYCHARDRGMQMMMMKILGTGTASENLGTNVETFEIDCFFRRMNWKNNLQSEIQKFNPSEYTLLQAYCDGVNAAFKKHQSWELKVLLGIKDFTWSKEDTILMVRMSGYLTLAQSQGEIERLFLQMVQHGVKKELLQHLFPGILEDYDENDLKNIKLTEKIVPDAIKWNVANTAFMASNNWAIAGKKSYSGKPLLASDPHLEINRLPAVWYEVAATYQGRKVHGATMPGLPSFIIGRTKNLAWGTTYSFMDAIDSWIEKCQDGKYFKDGVWLHFIERKESIKQKKNTAKELTFYENEHGTLEGDPYEKGYYLCTKWTGSQSGAQSIKAGFQLCHAKNVQEGMKHAGKIEGAFSWIFADIQDNIGFQMSGLMPKRKVGSKGFVPLPGWHSDNDWKGIHDPEDLPKCYNPVAGYIITANNNLNEFGNVAPINMAMGDYRANRIKQLLENFETLDVEHCKKMQYDTHSNQAELYMKIIRPLLPDSENGMLLKSWNLSYDIRSRGAYLFEMIYRNLYYEVFGKILGKSLVEFLKNQTGIFIDFYANFDAILLSEKSVWFRERDRDDIYKLAIESALSMKAKTWGEINFINQNHILLGAKLPKFFGFDKGPFPLPGGRATVQQGQVYTNAGRKSSFAPSFRFISDMSKQCLYTNYPGGVSDRRFSKLYHNDFSNWKNGTYKKFDFYNSDK